VAFSLSVIAKVLSAFFSGHDGVLYLSIRLVSFQRLPFVQDNDCNFCSNSFVLCLARTFFSELANLLYADLCDGSWDDWYLALALRFSTIRLRTCSGTSWKLE